MNRPRVIETLYRHPAASRFELANRTGLSRAAVCGLPAVWPGEHVGAVFQFFQLAAGA
jgi:hypothetical protein